MSTSSPLCRLLAGNNNAPTKIIDMTTTKATITSSRPNCRTPQAIIDYFKRSSKCPKFRRQRFHYEITVRQLADANHLSGIEDTIEHQKHYPDIRNEYFVVRLILLYVKAKMYDSARKLFNEMPQLKCSRTVFSFNALLEACLKSERYDKIGGLFRELPQKLLIEPDLVSYNTVIKALCKAVSLDSAVYFMDEIEKHEIKPNIMTCNTLLNAFHKSKRFFEAENLWDVMEKRHIVPDLYSYNIKLNGLVKANKVSEAIQVFEEIVNKGFKPDTFSYNAMIKMCVAERNLDDAKMWYKKMMQNGCLPDYATFTMLITLACDAKNFDTAQHLCKKAIKSFKVIYNCLMQRVVDGLVEHSKIENAKELVKLAKSCKSFQYEISLPFHK